MKKSDVSKTPKLHRSIANFSEEFKDNYERDILQDLQMDITALQKRVRYLESHYLGLKCGDYGTHEDNYEYNGYFDETSDGKEDMEEDEEKDYLSDEDSGYLDTKNSQK